VFPWTGLVPAGLLYWLRRGDSGDRGRGDASVFLAMWFIFGFALFAFMGTKFHHYIFPVVPALAMLVGVLLDEMIGRADAAPIEPRRRAHERTMLGAAAVAGACVVGLVARDLALKPDGGAPGAMRLLQLFTYNYRRVWPETLDFAKPIAVFGALAVTLGLALVVARIRRHVVALALVLAGAWAVFCLDVYMTQVSPHWGQRDVIAAYYTSRANDAEPLVAYQMNWKGESFYTGNRIATFVSTGTPFTTWMKEERQKGVKVMYFVTEHNRTGGLRSEVGGRAYREVTDRALCNKFVLVRAEL
jgi:4-amino-4-deoxy-L-arabinose transferase-like glycosyltransferase